MLKNYTIIEVNNLVLATVKINPRWSTLSNKNKNFTQNPTDQESQDQTIEQDIKRKI